MASDRSRWGAERREADELIEHYYCPECKGSRTVRYVWDPNESRPCPHCDDDSLIGALKRARAREGALEAALAFAASELSCQTDRHWSIEDLISASRITTEKEDG